MALSLNAKADFSLNFTPVANGVMENRTCRWGCGGADYTTGTDMLMENQVRVGEVVYHPVTGEPYQHFVIGSLDEGFIQEVYIAITAFDGHADENVTWDAIAAGGTHKHVIRDGAGGDPLGLIGTDTGNASANPKRVAMRQVMTDGRIHQEFLKTDVERKPRIMQTVTDPGVMESRFDIDMSNSTYNEIITPGIMRENVLNFFDPTMENFDVAAHSIENNYVNAGQYIYIDGAGEGGSEGMYFYLDGGESIKYTEWFRYFDLTEANPWTYDTYKPQ